MVKRGQQEMVGFVLIVVIVMIALMVFLVISVRQGGEEQESFRVDNMLSAVLDYTTGCAIVFEPQYDSIEDLAKSCFDNEKCNNLDKMACDYLNETVKDLMNDLIMSEATISAYQFDLIYRDDEGIEEGVLRIIEGNCSGAVSGASVPLVTQSGDLVIRLRICESD